MRLRNHDTQDARDRRVKKELNHVFCMFYERGGNILPRTGAVGNVARKREKSCFAAAPIRASSLA